MQHTEIVLAEASFYLFGCQELRRGQTSFVLTCASATHDTNLLARLNPESYALQYER